MSPWFLAFMLFVGQCCLNEAFKESEFKKCADSAFCTRNRQSTEERHYRIQEESLTLGDSEVSGRLVNDAVQKEFQFSLTSIAGPSVRLQITEASPVVRYRVHDVLLQDPPLTGPTWRSEKNEKRLRLCFPDATCIELHYDPFLLVAEREGRELMKINSHGLLHMEHTRKHGEVAPEGEWEESFKNFHDSKPKGPQAISLDLSYVGISHVFGIPEHSSHLSLPVTIENGEPVTEPYRMYNLDVFEYNLYSPFGLYGSIPFLLGQNQMDSVGVFWLNAAEMYIDIWKNSSGTHSQWIAESGVLDAFLMLGPTTNNVLHQYTTLTGTTALPPYFSLGYHQCRWNYRDEADVRNVDASFDIHGIPYDVLWLDIEHTDQKKYMTWDPTSFPNPAKMQEDIAAKGRKMVAIVDPHIKNDDNYPIHAEAKKKGFYVKDKDGKDFVGHCWPGASSYLDVTRPDVRAWWAERFQMGVYHGMTQHLYIWNDMNEPSVFNGPEITMQKDLLHSGTVEHRDVHNLYGYLYHWATNEGLMQRGKHVYGSDGDRPFVLSRAYFAGSQRLGPIWTGDNVAEWSHLKASIPMLLSNNLAGMAFCGADIGGFFGNPDAELFTRWYQLGVFYPFVRAHAHIETKRREPWLYGDETTTRVRRAVRERYALLPYVYTLFRSNNITGTPIMRPLWYDFLSEDIFDMEEQFMLGPALMIRPVLEPGIKEIETYFPPRVNWYDAWTGEKHQTTPEQTNIVVGVDLEKIPFYYRGGSIVVRKERPRRSTAAMKADPVTLVIALDENSHAEGQLYMDDGQSFAFLRSQFLHRQFTFAQNELTSIDLHKNDREVRYKAGIFVEKIVILGLSTKLDVHEKQTGQKIASDWGPLRLEPKISKTALVLKKPGLQLDEDWTLQFSQPTKQ